VGKTALPSWILLIGGCRPSPRLASEDVFPPRGPAATRGFLHIQLPATRSREHRPEALHIKNRSFAAKGVARTTSETLGCREVNRACLATSVPTRCWRNWSGQMAKSIPRAAGYTAKCSNASEFVSAFLTVPGYLIAYFTSFCLSKDRSSTSSRCGVSPLCSMR
jgi:hypothetical protein